MPETGDTNDKAKPTELDPTTQRAQDEDVDFAEEHQRPTVADESPHEHSNESVPADHGGMGIGPDSPP